MSDSDSCSEFVYRDFEDDHEFRDNVGLGYINKVSFMHLHGYFCHSWTIFHHFTEKVTPNSLQSTNIIINSPNFETGADNENVWFLKFIKNYHDKLDVQLYLVSCKEDIKNMKIELSLLIEENKKICLGKKSFHIDKSFKPRRVCEFKNIMTNEFSLFPYMKLSKRLTLLCEIMNPSTKIVKTPKNSKTDDLKQLLKNEKLSDVTISMGKSKFHLHKAILASRSPVFLAMFEHDTKESRENLVEITDIKENIMKVVILYIYTDEVEILEEDTYDVYAVADKYGIEGLKLACSEILSNSITIGSAFHTLVCADTYNDENLKINALNYITLNVKKTINTQGYKLLRNKYPHLVEKILEEVANNSNL